MAVVYEGRTSVLYADVNGNSNLVKKRRCHLPSAKERGDFQFELASYDVVTIGTVSILTFDL